MFAYWALFGLVVAASLLAGCRLRAKWNGGLLGDLAGAVMRASGWHAVALLSVMVVAGLAEDVVQAVRLLG